MGLRRVYHFCKSTYGITNLENQRLKVATIKDLNDPLELLCFNLSDRGVRRRMTRLKEHYHETVGFICFSRSYNSPVQWAHYGESHKGICLGFDVDESVLTPVRYESDRFAFDVDMVMNDNKYLEFGAKLLATKHAHWSYEEEERIVLELSSCLVIDGRRFLPFSHGLALKQVIVGCNSSISRSQLESALAGYDSNIEKFKARAGFTKYEIVRNENGRLWV